MTSKTIPQSATLGSEEEAGVYGSPALFFVFFLSFVAVKIVRVFSKPEVPKIYMDHNSKNSMLQLAQHCDSLQKPYIPPFLWGRNGHLQTAACGILNRAGLTRMPDRRICVKLTDGSTVTFDIFEPLNFHSSGGDFTLAVCPGVANSSESNYIRTCVHHAQDAGLRCAVLNHLGALKDLKLTSPRVFSCGETEEFDCMISKIVEVYPKTKIIALGFSLGGNLVTKYLGKNPVAAENIILGISVCQGYNAIKNLELLDQWQGFRRIYMYILTENMKRVLKHNYEEAVLPHVKSGLVDEQRIWAATSLYSLAEHFTRKVGGFSSADEYWNWSSSMNVISDIKVPMIFINALDDPLVPYPLLEPVIKFCENRPGFMFILTKHGGHLGFLQGGFLSPLSVSWLDRLIVQLCNSLIAGSFF